MKRHWLWPTCRVNRGTLRRRLKRQRNKTERQLWREALNQGDVYAAARMRERIPTE